MKHYTQENTMIKIVKLKGNVAGIVAMKKVYYFNCKTEGQRVIDTSMDDVSVLKYILRKYVVRV